MPNKITPADFEGWEQERGLYFWGAFDPHYQPVLGLKDPGEPEAKGALVYAMYGEGVYIYTGLSFFRELPAGVPGAYRLFVNLLSQTQHASRTIENSRFSCPFFLPSILSFLCSDSLHTVRGQC